MAQEIVSVNTMFENELLSALTSHHACAAGECLAIHWLVNALWTHTIACSSMPTSPLTKVSCHYGPDNLDPTAHLTSDNWHGMAEAGRRMQKCKTLLGQLLNWEIACHDLCHDGLNDSQCGCHRRTGCEHQLARSLCAAILVWRELSCYGRA